MLSAKDLVALVHQKAYELEECDTQAGKRLFKNLAMGSSCRRTSLVVSGLPGDPETILAY